MKKIWIFVFWGIMFLPQALIAQQAFPRVGVWDVTARDHRTVWTRSTLVIEEADGDAFRGYFYWYSIMNSEGREYFIGFYDQRNRKVEIRGERLSNDAKGLGLGIYTAYLSRNGRDLEEGTWVSFGGPGTWEAKWRQQTSSTEPTQRNNYNNESSDSVVTDFPTTRIFKIQVGAFVNHTNAHNAMTQLQRQNLNPVRENYLQYTRVILRRLPANMVENTLEAVRRAGFNEVWIQQDTSI